MRLDRILSILKEAQEDLSKRPVNEILDIFDDLAVRLSDPMIPAHAVFPQAGLPFLANWCRRSHLGSLLDEALGERQYLDGFLPSPHRHNRDRQALPRGIAVHWMAGNIPTLGVLSLVQGLVTKNANIVKVSSDSDYLLPHLLCWLGPELSASVAVIRYDRENVKASRFLSEAADVRVLWGGDDSIWALSQLPAKPGAPTVAFGGKTAFLAIGANALNSADLQHLADKAAQDISVFDQKACVSPHSIILETSDWQVLAAFAEALKKALADKLTSFPRSVPSASEVQSILAFRARYDMLHQAWYSPGAEFTILADDLCQLGPAIGGRTVFLRRVENLEQVAEWVTSAVDTVGIAAGQEQYDRLTSLLARCGVSRFTPIGSMTNYDSPWNGVFLLQHCVRWVSRPTLQREPA